MGSLLATLGAIFFIGLPVALSLSPRQQIESEKLWIIAPFLGIGVVILILQNLIYLGIPISKSYLGIWIGAGLLWCNLIRTGVIRSLLPIPLMVLVIALLVCLLHGLGLVQVGAANYVGRGWYDQFSYVTASQFLMDYSLPNAVIKDLIYQPTAIKGFLFTATDRIGEVILQGFMACSLLTNAKSSFEPVILLSPFLIVLAMFELAKRFSLSKNTALIVSALAASLPAVALIHLESFLSQALAVPLLLLWPCILDEAFKKPNSKNILLATILLATAASIYVEFYFIFLLMAFCFAVVKSSRKNLVLLFCLILSALCLNLGFVKQLFEIAIRPLHVEMHLRKMVIYPWANSLTGLHWLWLGDYAWLLKGWGKHVFDGVSILFFILAYFGMGCVAYKKRDGLSISVFILMLLPLIIWLKDINHLGYQFYKLLMSISPLFPMAITLAFKQGIRGALIDGVSYCMAVLIGLVTVSSTLTMVWATTQPEVLAHVKRGMGYRLLDADTREVQDKLERLADQNILINWHEDIRRGDFINGWLAYFARHNNVWLSNSYLGDENLRAYIASQPISSKTYLLLTSANNASLIREKKIKKLWNNQAYALWKVGVIE